LVVDTVGAFCPHGRFRLEGQPDGLLHGLAFAAKDLFDVAGHVTGAGNPRWLQTHPLAERTAFAIEACLAAGARMIGKTITDELAYSLNGDNTHYGTPKNTKAPDRVPGGSSSGSAAAVAAGLCDFAISTDTAGSTRVPASFCGTFGIRTTHGSISTEGLVPLMPSFDTVGWLARDPGILSAVGDVLVPREASENDAKSMRLLVAADALAVTDPDVTALLKRGIERIKGLFASIETVTLAHGDGLAEWRGIFRTASAHEAWQIHGAWIEAQRPAFAWPIAERFMYAKAVSDTAAAAARAEQEKIRTDIRGLVASNGILCIPSAPGPAPKLGASGEAVEAFRVRTQCLTSIASLSGLPEVSLPMLDLGGLPVGLSLIGPAHFDRGLLGIANQLFANQSRH
jgi:amidase